MTLIKIKKGKIDKYVSVSATVVYSFPSNFILSIKMLISKLTNRLLPKPLRITILRALLKQHPIIHRLRLFLQNGSMPMA